jgi:Ran GTPase-activating protein (RanGAP) involved in mRNA processing and transport
MKRLQELRLSDCNMGDRGAILVLQGIDYLTDVVVLDLSGNQLGKSPSFNELTQTLVAFIHNHIEINSLMLDDNNLRGANGDKILKAVSGCYALSYLSLRNNFLGVAQNN